VDTKAADLIEERMAGLFFRIQLLDPQLRRVGWGQAEAKDRGWFGVLDIRRGRGSALVVVYPAENQKAVPLAFPGNEIPDPIPQAKEKKAGYPVTVTFPAGMKVRQVVAKLLDSRDKEVSVWLSTPETPVIDAGLQMNSICLIAKNPLSDNADYKVTIEATVNGEPWQKSWKFTTGSGQGWAFKPGDNANSEALSKTVVNRVNFFRREARLGPVEIDPALSKGCQSHADYLVKNAKHPSTKGLGAHEERPDLPGFSIEGQRAGKASDISLGLDPQGSVDGYVSTFFHRIPILDPELRRIGFGVAKDDDLGWVSVVDVQSGRGDNQPVAYPAEGQKDVPLEYIAGERPDPIPESKDKVAGYPITLTFPRTAVISKGDMKLKTEAGQDVTAWLSTPERSVNQELQRNTLCLIAKQPLRPKTTYRVTAEAIVEGQPWTRTWSFTTKGQ
jgi:uncharacterized protein YkwD